MFIIPALSLVLSMTLRFIPRFRQQLKLIVAAQRSMGKDLRKGSLVQRMRTAGMILSILVSWALENGVITLYNRLLSKIRADHDLLLEETDIDSILTGCSTEYGSEIQTLVERGAESFVADLFRTLRERKIELRTGKVIFVGGGSLLLRKQIEKSGKVGTAIFVEEIGANAAGYGFLYAATKTSR